ncbi:MAG: hypothetical protein AAB589_00770 [Patescibacteria group bacterium]
MINLLPIEDRLKLKAEYHRRLIITWSGVLLAVCISALILETSFFLVLWHKRQALERVLVQISTDAKPAQFDELEQALAKTADEVAVLLVSRRVLPLTQLLIELVAKEQAVAGVSVGDMTFDLNSGAGILSLHGLATTRQTFLNFVKALTESELLETVDYPVNNLINEKNIRFALEITLKNPKP